MPPLCSIDIENLGPAFLLGTSFDDDACLIKQTIHVPNALGDEHFLRDLKMVSTQYTPTPRVVAAEDGMSFDLLFHPDTVVDTIPVMIEDLMVRLTKRRLRLQGVRETGPAFVVHGDLSDRIPSRTEH